MGDRNNPIKFGPEWLRNLSRERSAIRASNNQANSSAGAAAAAAAAGSPGGAAASNSPSNIANNINNTHNTAGPSKILLAKLRYGREEMLALYDRNSEAPPELKSIDAIYQPRGKQPLALNNTFEDDMRDNMRGAPPVGGMSSADRYGMGRGAGRGGTSPGRGTGTRTYTRPSTAGRGSWHVGSPRTPGYGGGADEDGSQMRPWNNNSPANRNSGDQTEWANKSYRSKRPGTNTNWRQHPSREEGEEWRSSEPGRSRQLEKWDRDWGERPGQDKSQSSWNTNRRTWVGGDTHSNENLPEWIGENAECGGTFDSQGAFHGYSNDDTNLPKNQESTYPLTRSHTHSSFARSKTVEEGSEEWWASEKAKKLSPKRFDASDIKFKKGHGEAGTSASTSKEYGNKSSTNKNESQKELPEQQDNTATAPEPPEPSNNAHQNEDKYAGKNVYKTKYAESKTFDAKMRSDINMDEANDERGNFQSVLIASNNGLRQKHQHIVPASEPSNKAPSSKAQSAKTSSQNKSEADHGAHKSPDDVLVVNNMFRMPYDELEILSSTSPNSSLLTMSSTGSLVSSTSTNPHQNSNMQMNMSNAGMQNQGLVLDPNINKQNMQAPGHETPGMQGGGHPSVGMQSGMQTQGMPTSGIQSGKQAGMHNTGMPQHGIQNTGMPSGGMQNPVLSQVGLQSPGKPSGMHNPGMQSGVGQNARMPMPMQNPGMGRGVMQNPGMHAVGLPSQGMPVTGMHLPRIQNPAMQSSMMQQGGINSALNASLGLPIGPAANMGMPHNVPQPGYPNAENIGASGMQGAIGNAPMQPGANMPGFQTGNGIAGISNAGNSSLFLGQNTNNPSMSSPNDIPMPNHSGQNNMFPMHGLQHSASQGAFGNPMYGNNMPNPAEQWYYEDPESNIQGPFSTRDMLNWYRAGFFSATLMVRRACETGMRPLGSYGPVPFATMDMMPPFPMAGSYDARAQGGHDTMLNTQGGLGLDVMKMNRPDNPPVEPIQFGSVGQMGIPSFNHPPPPMVDLLWSQTSNDLRWMHNSMNESRVNNLSMFFWDQQPSAIASNALLPEEITKEMKTEDQILAQLRASQNIGQPPPMPYMEQPPASAAAPAKTDDRFAAAINATPNLEELHRLMQKDTLAGNASAAEPENNDTQLKTEKTTKLEPPAADTNVAKSQNTSKAAAEAKSAKQKAENDKAAKTKDNNNTKSKGKKNKDDKKDEVAEAKTKEDEVNKAEKRSQESSPSKTKKEDKSNKKDLEREKKEWIKEGFTIVKGTEKTVAKDGKKKAEEARAADEAERKRKEEEKLAAEEEKRKKQAEAQKKQQEQQQQQQQRQATDSVAKKAPWSAAANLTLQAVHKDGLTLAEIQRLEREKKLEQMKEQQQMMQIIAQQQAAALAREQEMQAGLGWAKNKGKNFNAPGQSLTEIQAEARKQAVVAAAAAAAAAQAQALEEAAAPAQPQTNHVPWANTHNGVGFWDTPPNQPSKPEKPQEPAKPAKPTEPSKNKKKLQLLTPVKKETSPAAEFESWCTSFLSPWSAKIDVPTFIGFLKDIESPYEVKDYVKCYLGDSKDSNDFARQFLERRSKLLRVGMVTPSDDLCSPALAVTPRTISGSDYQEVKGKGKKSKKNKMLKIDARILGFSVTAAEDRINVGDIDSV